ncbi:hypothetical protein [Streptomyces sp. A1499]|nr:hypothetical protein [Streptomyces sp. A1499]
MTLDALIGSPAFAVRPFLVNDVIGREPLPTPKFLHRSPGRERAHQR